jgi:hypothetical protein
MVGGRGAARDEVVVSVSTTGSRIAPGTPVLLVANPDTDGPPTTAVPLAAVELRGIALETSGETTRIRLSASDLDAFRSALRSGEILVIERSG